MGVIILKQIKPQKVKREFVKWDAAAAAAAAAAAVKLLQRRFFGGNLITFCICRWFEDKLNHSSPFGISSIQFSIKKIGIWWIRLPENRF